MSFFDAEIDYSRLKNICVVGGPGVGEMQWAESLATEVQAAFAAAGSAAPVRLAYGHELAATDGDSLHAENVVQQVIREVQTRTLDHATIEELQAGGCLFMSNQPDDEVVAHAAHNDSGSAGPSSEDPNEWTHLRPDMQRWFVVLCWPREPMGRDFCGPPWYMGRMLSEEWYPLQRLLEDYRTLLEEKGIAFHEVEGEPSGQRTSEVLRAWFEIAQLHPTVPSDQEADKEDEDTDDDDGWEELVRTRRGVSQTESIFTSILDSGFARRP